MSTACDTSQARANIINLANDLLQICSSPQLPDGVPAHITSLSQLTSHVYVFLYESVCSMQLIDKKWPTHSLEDEIHNVQAVIDSLSLDLLHEDLSHLTGEAICGAVRISIGSDDSDAEDAGEAGLKRTEPNLVSIEYLLDILRCIHEWITSRLESTADGSVKEEVVAGRDERLEEETNDDKASLGEEIGSEKKAVNTTGKCRF